jgi:NAD(P)-dependent dehydrogenase (short-subunit alcohol dehydrogenase family)
LAETVGGKEIVVVGGAGGIGSAVTELLLGESARLVLVYKSNAARARRWTGRATVLQADITVRDGRSQVLAAAPAIYALVVLAGDPARVADPAGTEAMMRRSHEANYLGPVLLAREAADRMKAAATPGAIVLVSTMQANALFAGSTVYAAQKAALQHAARVLAKECRGPANIRVNVVSPGVTAAGMAEPSIASGKYDRYLREGAIHRFGQAADIAHAIRFFLQPDSYITGQVLCVDGGLTL